MSSINPLGAGTTAGELPGQSVSLEKESFLKLLVAQISNQDPLKPQESDQFMQQLTQFSSLEQLMNLNQGVQNLMVGQLSSNSQEALRFVGREVLARGDSFDYEPGTQAKVDFHTDPEARKAKVTVYDDRGNAVYTTDIPVDESGRGTFTWNGTNDEGGPQRGGRYTVSFEATDGDGQTYATDTFVRGVVTGVRFDQGFPELLIGDRRLRFSDVVEVKGG